MTKRIQYDVTTKDFAVVVDGRTIGHAHSYHEGEVMADTFVFEALMDGLMHTATELDGGVVA